MSNLSRRSVLGILAGAALSQFELDRLRDVVYKRRSND